jgi:REP element-mobilizing transposase RayT
MMHPDTFYHIFNRGNQRQLLFLREHNYPYFMGKISNTFINDIHLIAFCLMPNHFHLMAYTSLDFNYQQFSRRLGVMLRSYTRGLQNQEHFVGSLFQQNTRRKELKNPQDVYNCFQYIHQNPVNANLATKLEQWKYSSFNEYLNSTPKLCNVDLGRQLLDLPAKKHLFYQQSIAALKKSKSASIASIEFTLKKALHDMKNFP